MPAHPPATTLQGARTFPAHTVPARRQRLGLLALLLTASALLLVGCASTLPPPRVTAVTPFDVQRYAGRWYELARLDHAFERGMTDVSATYTAQADGSVRVVNRGYAPATGQWREAVGKALFTGAPTTGSLKVSFFGPFYGGYHVAALDPDYRWSLVVGPNTGYAWILARDKQLPAAQRDAIVARAQALGVDTSALIWVTHERQDPTH
ncbi:MAG: lipocalin family protein [Rugosibacter sp.]|jgi:apolipoprotein D and lipocalin family protein|nr:lipocalin family protein [Rugosibacter sp.]